MMQTFFSPALALSNRLRYSQKFLLAALLAAISIGALFFSLHRQLQSGIDSGRNELRGIAVASSVNHLVQLTQEHRGLSSGVLNGNETLKAPRNTKSGEVAAALAEVDAALAPALRASQEWQRVRDDWQKIQADGLNWAQSANFSAHTDLVGRMLNTAVTVADHYEMTLERALGTYYLMDIAIHKLPSAQERMGQLRALGTGILAKQELTEERRTQLLKLMAELEDDVRKLKQNAEKVRRHATAAGDEVAAGVDGFAQTSREATRTIEQAILSGAFNMEPKAYFEQMTTAIGKGNQLINETIFPSLARLVEDRVQSQQRSLYVQLAVQAGLLFLLCYFMTGMYLSITENIGRLAREADRMAQGDLTTRVTLSSQDELTRVSTAFNHMAESVGLVIKAVGADVEHLRLASHDLSRSAAEIAIASNHQSSAAANMAAAVEEMTASIDSVAQNAQQARDATRQARELSHNGSRTVSEVVRDIQAIAGSVNDSAQDITSLEQHSVRISSIVESIREIADQTNLLALNAAIEAARAGEQGRGFAVVADEVRKLAERTTHSTSEISGMISAISEGTQSAVRSMETGVASVHQGVAATQNAGALMGDIESGAEQVLTMVSDISAALSEQSVAAADVARNVEQVAQMAEENSGMVAGNADTARRLMDLADTLSREVGRFQV
ncbi:hypothetical protein B9N43_03135 [Denitratisoma sp. DHT3]|uniref:methyl-accepting chemotaxis protein n=1 Tax=Denitratisoma sp. DHT3 TaxID=1981880 RepID=UPI0011987296|nr:methyl-accepting chemotaxis protein [Denitratisoma sp. DHT3]QDX80345.1 hypothetical protein B9N43_03135 [Denitratisoma sp. DHT3]